MKSYQPPLPHQQPLLSEHPVRLLFPERQQPPRRILNRYQKHSHDQRALDYANALYEAHGRDLA